MELIEWTKGYRVHHANGEFKLFVSKHAGSGFYASLLYYEKSKDVSVSPPQGLMRFHLQTEFGNPERAALDKIENWIKQSLPGEYFMEQMPPAEVTLSKAEPKFEEIGEVNDEMPWTKF